MTDEEKARKAADGLTRRIYEQGGADALDGHARRTVGAAFDGQIKRVVGNPRVRVNPAVVLRASVETRIVIRVTIEARIRHRPVSVERSRPHRT